MSETTHNLIDLLLSSLLREKPKDTPKISSITVDPNDPINKEILNRLVLIYRLCIAKNNTNHSATSENLNYPFYAKIFILHELQRFGHATLGHLSSKVKECDLEIFASCFEEISQLCDQINIKEFNEIPIEGRAVKLVHAFNLSDLHFEAGTFCLLNRAVDTIDPHTEYSVFLITRNNHKFVSVGVAGASITF